MYKTPLLGLLLTLFTVVSFISASAEDETPVARVALCFYGLSRSTRYTIASIEEHILEPLKKNNVEYDIFVHSYIVKKPQPNPRAREKQSDVELLLEQREDYKLLNPTKLMLSTQDDVDKVIVNYNPLYAQVSGRYRYGEKATKLNIFRARHSMEMAWNVMDSYLAENNLAPYDSVVFLRPDVLFLSDLDLPSRLPMPPSTIFAPSFHAWGGVNDRFAYGDCASMHRYAHRIEDPAASQDSKGGKKWLMWHFNNFSQPNTEIFLRSHLESKKVHVTSVDMEFARIRVNGKVNHKDKGMLEKAANDPNRSKSAREYMKLVLELEGVET
ncbi:unnamed protein product [Chrysoparadoxa australica]